MAQRPVRRRLRAIEIAGIVALLIAATGAGLFYRASSSDRAGSTGVGTYLGPTSGARSGILRVAAQGVADFVTLDPAINTDYSSQLPISMIYNGLVRLQIKPDGSFGDVVGDGARSWEISRDGRVYTFHLRPDLRFSDGTPASASDFVYSITRSLSPGLIGGNGYFYFLPIVGALKYYLNRAGSVDGLRAIDAHTLRITLVRPTAYFLKELTWTTGDVVERRVVERYGDSWTDHPAGTGPFMIKNVTHKVGMSLVPNPYWFGGRLRLKEVQIPLIQSTETAYNAYQTRQVDIIGVGPQGIPARIFVSALRRPDVHVAPGLSIDGLDLSQKGTPFTNIHLRRAFALALDKRVIARVLGYSVTPTDGYTPEAMPGFDPHFVGLHFDPAAARRELALAGFPGGRNFPAISLIYYTGSSAVEAEAQALQQIWQQVLGVHVSLKATELGALIQDLISRNFEIALSQAAAVYPDPHTSVFPLESTSGFWSDAHFDALSFRADSTVGNDPLRYRLYHRALEYAAQQVPWIPLDVLRLGVMIDPRIHGLTAISFGVATNDWSQVVAG